MKIPRAPKIPIKPEYPLKTVKKCDRLNPFEAAFDGRSLLDICEFLNAKPEDIMIRCDYEYGDSIVFF